MIQTNQHIQQILAAASFAAKKHSAQKRKGKLGEPYVNHVLEVAELVAGALAEPDSKLVVAALLHDTVEDTDTSHQELEEYFGRDVAALVAELTDNKALPKSERKRLQIVNAPKKSERAAMIKLADKISNLRSILASPPVDWNWARKKEYFDWAKQVVDGLTSANPVLKAEFDRVVKSLDEAVQPEAVQP
ncbi:MAG: HD domain-containing protein [Bryobacteraceae bacterium]